MPRYEGYRYIRQSHTHASWALWEQQSGKMRRVGTARTYEDARAFLYAPESIDAHVAFCLNLKEKPCKRSSKSS